MDYVSKIQVPGGTTYNITGVIPMGTVASTSTSTVYTATISGITELKSGVCVWLTNGVVTSAANFTININGLGAKPVYRSNAATTRETTRFDKAYTIFLIYNETRVSGGCWDYVYGFDSNTTYTNMSQSEASAGTVTTGRIISAKVLSTTIEEHTAEINAVLPELVDDGAKNVLQYNGLSSKSGDCTFTFNSDGSITVNGTTSSATSYVYLNLNGANVNVADFCNGNYILSGCPTNSSGLSLQVRGTDYTKSETGDGVELTTYSGSGIARVTIMVAKNSTIDNLTIHPMICTKAAWDISQEYTPYALPNPELTAATIETVNNGAKNEFCFDSVGTIINDGYICAKQFSANGVTFTLNADNTITATRTESSNYDSGCILMYNGKPAYIDSFFDATHILSGCPAGGTANTYSIGVSTKAVGPDSGVYELGDGLFLPPKREVNLDNMFLNIRYSSSYSGTITYKPMICTFPQWNISREYQPYALPNPELTAAAVEVVDNGPKNLLNHTAYTRTVNKVTYTVNADRSIQISSAGDNTQSLLFLVQNYTLPAGRYVLSGCSGGSSTTYDLRISVGGSAFYINYDGGTEFTYNGIDTFEASIVVRAGQTVNITMKPMICLKALWDISQVYQPYVPTNGNLYENKIDVVLNVIPSGTTLQAFADSLPLGTHHCFYNSANNASDVPVNVHAIVDVHKYSSSTGDMTFSPISTTYHNREYRKILSSGSWRDWQEFVGGTAKLTLGNNANLNDYTYACEVVSPSAAVSATIQNTPWTASGFSVKTVNYITDSAVFQFLLPNTTTGKWYRRRYGSGAWSSWVEYDAASYLINGATAIASNTDMNTLKTPGVYTCASYSIASSLTNCAYKSSGFRCDVIQTSDTNCIRQIIQPNQMTTTGGNARYERSCVISSNTWSSWYKFEGTVVT